MTALDASLRVRLVDVYHASVLQRLEVKVDERLLIAGQVDVAALVLTQALEEHALQVLEELRLVRKLCQATAFGEAKKVFGQREDAVSAGGHLSRSEK